MDNERCNDLYFQLDILTITPSIFSEILNDKFMDPDNDDMYSSIKQTKIWSIDAETMSFGHVLDMGELFRLLERVTECKVQELRFNHKDLAQCYYGYEHETVFLAFMPSLKGTYSGWTVKTISVRRCVIGVEFLSNILSDRALFVEGTNCDSYTGKNLIEEIRIIDCETAEPSRRVIDSERETILKQEILQLLETNYRVRNIDIVNTPTCKKNGYSWEKPNLNDIEESKQLDCQIKLLLDRNNRGHHLCRLAIQNILLIRKYRNSVLDLVGKDIILLICGLLLDSKGTSIWCMSELSIESLIVDISNLNH